MKIYEKLEEARKIIRKTNMGKDGKNSFSNYEYFTPEQVEALVSDACEKTKLICLTNLCKDEHGYFQTLHLVNIEEPEEILEFELRTEKPSIKATNDTQQMGGMDTYSERYIKMKVFQIKDNALDFDSQDNREEKRDEMEMVSNVAYLARTGQPIPQEQYFAIEEIPGALTEVNEAKKEWKRTGGKVENPNAVNKIRKSAPKTSKHDF